MNNTALALLPLTLAYIMFTLGAGLKLSDFKVIAKYPKAFFVGLINQVVLVPLVALAVVLVTAPPPAIAFGIMLISFCPGGVTSNMLTYYAKGNVALSIALTGVVSILSVITLPILITLAFDHFMKDQDVPFFWFTDGIGWFTALNPLEEAYEKMEENIYNLLDLKEDILDEIIK